MATWFQLAELVSTRVAALLKREVSIWFQLALLAHNSVYELSQFALAFEKIFKPVTISDISSNIFCGTVVSAPFVIKILTLADAVYCPSDTVYLKISVELYPLGW